MYINAKYLWEVAIKLLSYLRFYYKPNGYESNHNFEKQKERYISAFSILHEQTTAKARSKLVG